MAADFNKPALADSYTAFAQAIRDIAADLAKGLDPSLSLGTLNTPTNAIRWNGTTSTWERYNGSTWAALASTHNLNAATASAWATGRTITLTGDATATSGAWTGSGNLSFAITLATVNANVGSFGSASAVPVITVNAKGLITGVSTAALGTIATQAANNVAITGGAISATALTLVQSTTAAPTAEGRVEWDTDDDTLVIGTGAATKIFAPLTPTAQVTMFSHTFSTNCNWNGNAVGVQYGGTGVATLTGLVKGNGTSAFTAAVAGTDYLAPAAIGVTVQAYDAQLSSLIRQNSQSAAYTCVLSDGGKHLLHPSADTTARTFTIPANASVAYPVGTALTFVNQASAGVLTIAITTDTMRLAGAGTTGSRTLAANGVATALKITSTEWIISGTGLT